MGDDIPCHLAAFGAFIRWLLICTAVCDETVGREWQSFMGREGRDCVIEMCIGATLLSTPVKHKCGALCQGNGMIDVRLPWHMLGVHR
jgi:hypothetical protein